LPVAPILEDPSRSGADPHPTDSDLKREEPANPQPTQPQNPKTPSDKTSIRGFGEKTTQFSADMLAALIVPRTKSQAELEAISDLEIW